MKTKHETTAQFLARGGTITQVPRGVTGYPTKLPRHITYSKNATPHAKKPDPKAAGKAANQRIFE